MRMWHIVLVLALLDISKVMEKEFFSRLQKLPVTFLTLKEILKGYEPGELPQQLRARVAFAENRAPNGVHNYL